MSKAFTRESDDAGALPRPVSMLPPGVKNYLTRAGAERLRTKLHALIEIERPRLTVASSGPELRERLAALEQQIGSLQASLESAVVVDPPRKPWDRVRFGATVTV